MFTLIFNIPGVSRAVLQRGRRLIEDFSLESLKGSHAHTVRDIMSPYMKKDFELGRGKKAGVFKSMQDEHKYIHRHSLVNIPFHEPKKNVSKGRLFWI